MNYSFSISPEGSITIPDVGPVYLSGLNIAEAENAIRDRLSEIYSGIGGEKPNTFMKLSLGKIRSFTINVVGDVERPGTYTLPSLSTLFSALYMAGGPTRMGTVRDIKLYRGGRLHIAMDVYDFIIRGDFSKNIRLEDNDLIKVEPFISHVSINGAVKRPMTYDMKEHETVLDILKYAAGFSGNANQTRVQLIRINGDRKETFDIPASQFGTFLLKDGDAITVDSNISKNKNMVTINGSVWYPGSYAISENNGNIKDLIGMAGGLREETYWDRAVLTRFDESRDVIQMHFNVRDVMEGRVNIQLENEDNIRIFTNNELIPNTSITTRGEFNRPGTHTYHPGMTLGDAIVMSGGYTVGAAVSNVEVARRNQNDGSKVESDTVATVFNFDLLANPGDEEFALMPFDIVTVRVAPNFKAQKSITIQGEVIFPGTYVIEKNVVRVSDIVKRAGGFNKDAYVEGCVIARRLSDEERARFSKAMQIAQQKMNDSTTFSAVDLNSVYTIGIKMDEIMKNPGSYDDVILREGDVIRVPQMNNTVKISGGVLNKNVISFRPEYDVADYVQQAGGYIKKARKSQIYVTYMNGDVATRKSRGGLEIRPGCEIIVPIKEDNRRSMSTAEVMAIATSTASIATMVVSIVNLLKK